MRMQVGLIARSVMGLQKVIAKLFMTIEAPVKVLIMKASLLFYP